MPRPSFGTKNYHEIRCCGGGRVQLWGCKPYSRAGILLYIVCLFILDIPVCALLIKTTTSRNIADGNTIAGYV
jgi:hypothetical protein